MHAPLATVAALFMVCMFAWPAAAAERLTLDDAFSRIARTHPDLRLMGPRGDVLSAERDLAELRPVVTAGATVENAFGSGTLNALDSAETTLTLASVLERGGKLDARRVLAQSQIDALAIERESRRLDLLAEVARRYLAVIEAQSRSDISILEIAQRQRSVTGARQRLEAGASPESVVLSAQAALARAELDLDRSRQQSRSARQHLAILWGERNPAFEVAYVDPTRLPDIDSIEALSLLLERSPELAQFVGEQRIREARLRLARTVATPDLDWQMGVRRLQDTDDTGLVGSLSMPLGSARRAGPGIRAAEAELVSLEIEREVSELSLHSTLTDAHGRYRSAALEVQRLQDDVLPLLARAESAADRAYRQGAISYLEWAQLLSEQNSARRQQLEAALTAQRALIELQRLTGQAFVAQSATATGTGVSQ